MKKVLNAVVILFVLLVVGFVALWFRPSLIRSKEEVKAAFRLPQSKFVTWRGGEIHYVEEGSGIPLVMIHGFSGSHRNFGKIAETLKSDFRVIRLDLPGFGLSDFPALKEGETSLHVYRDYINFIINELQLDSFYLMGNSMGGMVSWTTAHDHPVKVKKLILCASAGYDLEKVAGNAVWFVKNPITSRLLGKGVPEFVSKQAALKCWYDDTQVKSETVRQTNMIWNRDGNTAAALVLGAATEFPDTAWIKEIKCPTLIVWGKQDEIVPFEHAARFHRDIAGSQLLAFDKCGHLPMIEKEKELKERILQFTKE